LIFHHSPPTGSEAENKGEWQMADSNNRGGRARPFEGLRVLDLTHVLAGPFAAYQLAVMGADTIKIEEPTEGDMVRSHGGDKALNHGLMGTHFLTQNSNKKSLTLNLKTDQGRAILKRLVKSADVFIENYRAGALDAIGLGYDDLNAINPRLVYCAMTGYGQTGPKRGHTAYDQVIQAASGIMSLSGTPEVTPIKVGPAVLDYGSGISAAFAISAALFERERSGKGQYIDCSMLDAAMTLMGNTVTAFFYNGSVPPPPGNANAIFAGSSCYETKDGRLIMLGAYDRRQHMRLWTALGRPDLAKLGGSWDDMRANYTVLTEALTAAMKTKTADEWEDVLNRIPIPAAKVRTLPEAATQPQMEHRGVFHTYERVPGTAGPVTVPVAAFTYKEGGPRLDTPPPTLGADTETLLGDMGFSPAEIQKLRGDGVV
jgi:crotonobetainyl-CoA:carnitine CoA-transferase CaiB-like acyl-CoA transferase